MHIQSFFKVTPVLIKQGVGTFWKGYFINNRELFFTTLFAVVLLAVAVHQGWQDAGYFILIGFWGLSFWFWRIRLYFVWLHDKMGVYNRLTDGSMGIVLEEDGISIIEGAAGAKFSWNQLRAINEKGDILLLLWGGKKFSILPINQISPEALSVLREKSPRRFT